MNIREDVQLAPFTNWRVGGPADYFVEVTTEEEMRKALDFANKKNIPFFVLGGGTNILVGDKGYRGLVIRNRMNQIRIVAYKGKGSRQENASIERVYVRVDSGVLTNRLVRFTVDNGLSGLENFLGQPGSVGGAMYINAHNMNQNDFFGDHVVEAKLLSKTGEIESKPVEYFEFGYDVSTLQSSGEIVISVTVELTKVDKKIAWEKAEAAMKYRHSTQPKGRPTAGCTFRNISAEDAKRIKTPKGIRSAGYLIDKSGLKGKQIGDAKISDEHANFILNLGSATAADIRTLIEEARDAVYDKYGVDLEEEVVLVGEFTK